MVNLFLNYNWGTTRLYHRVVCQMRENMAISRIGATVVGREPYDYLKNQTDIDYDPLYCAQDVHIENNRHSYDPARLEDLEERYGVPNLWPAIWADRNYINYTSEKQKRLLQGWFDFYLDIFEDFDPDVFLTSSVDSTYTWIPFRIVTEDYGTSIRRMHTRIRDRESIHKTINNESGEIYDCYKDIPKKHNIHKDYKEPYLKAKSFINEFRNKEMSPSYNKTGSSSDSTIIREAVGYWYNKNLKYYKNDFYHDSTYNRIKLNLKRKYWRIRMKQLDLFQEPNYDDSYVFFPLHLQPEASTLVHAPMYIELPNVIRDISKSLPINYKIYVKEHPSLYKYKIRPTNYYKEIDNLPNTVLIHPNISSHNLIKNAEAITTVTGTVGLEALFHKKPVITFGNPNYNMIPQVYSGGDPKELAALVSNVLEDYVHTEDHERELLAYLTAVFETSHPSAENKTGDELADAIDKQSEKLRDVISNEN